MESKLYQELETGATRKSALECNCLKKEKRPVKQYHTPEQLEKMRVEFMNYSIEIEKLVEELEAKRLEIRNKLKPLEDTCEMLREQSRVGCVEVEEEVYLFDFQEEGQMGVYDRAGDLIESRRLTPEEKQTNVVSATRK